MSKHNVRPDARQAEEDAANENEKERVVKDADGNELEINDAIVVNGPLDESVLAREVTLGYSNKGQETRPGKWKNQTTTLATLLVHVLSQHRQGRKDGFCLLQGSVIEGQRKAKAVEHLDIVMLDCDTGDDIDALTQRLQDLGLFGVIWTTYSHLKPTTEIAETALKKWSQVDDPDIDEAKAFLREVRRYRDDVLVGAELEGKKLTGEGAKYVVRHKPLPKFRVLLPLAERYDMMARGGQDAAIQEWKERYAGVSDLLGVAFDRSCVDPSRLMFTPRHPAGAEDYEIRVINGQPLDIETVERIDIRKRRESNPFLEAAGGDDPGYKTEGLLRFLARHGHDFLAEDFFEAHLEDRGNRSGPGHHFACPNDDAHSNPGDPEDKGFFAVSGPDADHSDGFVAKCMHDSCSELDRGHMVDLVCQEHGLGCDDLLKYCVDDDDDESESANNTADDEPAFEDPDISSLWLPTKQFSVDAFGYIKTPEMRKGNPTGKHIRVCQLFEPIAQKRMADGSGWGVLIHFRAPDGALQEVTIDFADLQGDLNSARKALADRGLWIKPGQNPGFAMLAGMIRPTTFINEVRQPGFYSGGKVFVAPTGEIIDRRPRKVRKKDKFHLPGSASVEIREPAGDLNTWFDDVADLACSSATYLPHLMVALCQGFAGPLTAIEGADTTGINFFGDSSKGKSLSAKVAASIWSHPRANFGVLVEDATTNAVEFTFTRANGALAVIDELGKFKKADDVAGFLFKASGGASKIRMTADQGQRRTATWNTAVIFTAERPLISFVGRDHWFAGMAVRFADIPVASLTTNERTYDVAESIKYGLKSSYGTAGPEFARYLIDEGYTTDVGKVVDAIDDAAEVFTIPDDIKDQTIRRARWNIFGRMLAAGRLAQNAGLIPDDADLEAATRWAWGAYLSAPGSTALSPKAEAIATLRRTIIEKWDVEIVLSGIADKRRDALAWYDDDVVYIPIQRLSELAGGKVDSHSLAKELKEVGILQEQNRNLSHVWIPKVMNNLRHYRLDRETLGIPVDIGDEPKTASEKENVGVKD